MSILSWNCRGLGNPRTIPEVVDLVSKKKRDLIFLMETKMCRLHAERLRIKIEFDGLEYVDSLGLSGGLALMWRCNEMVDLASFSRNHIDAVINLPLLQPWRFTGYYGFPERGRRAEAWDFLQALKIRSELPWLVVGDFNDLAAPVDKRGLHPHSTGLLEGFSEALNDCKMETLPMVGHSFTWERGRGTR